MKLKKKKERKNATGISNERIAEILEEIGDLLEAQGIPFKPRAYKKAAEAVVNLGEEASDIYREQGVKELEKIPAVGASIAKKIQELIETGHLSYYEKLKKKAPIDLLELTAIEGLGPKQAVVLYRKLGIKNINDLEKAAQEGRIRRLKGFSVKKEANLLRGIRFLKQNKGRVLLSEAWPQARMLEERLRRLKGVKKIIIAGSLRRRKETIGDIDLLLVANKPTAKKVMDFFAAMPEVDYVYAKGLSKTMIRLNSGLDVDLRVVPERSFGAALNYFTGSKEHNIALRELALEKGWKLSEYGLFKGKKQIAGRTEEDLYKRLGMDYIEPELREMQGELGAAQSHNLPKLISYTDLKGDLQIQTNWSDGANSIEEMALEAEKLGLEYILITDHTKKLAMAHGLDEKRLLKQMKVIDELNKKMKSQGLKIRILKGTECDIHKNGQLDIQDKVLEKLDIVGAAVHSYFHLSEKEQTERIKKAMSNPHVDIIFHPTGRLINRRPAYKVNIDELIEYAKKTKTILEIDAFPSRLDLKDKYIRKCVEAGVKMSISSDAHAVEHIQFLKYGIAQARRGWAEKKDIINAWPLKKMLSMLKGNN